MNTLIFTSMITTSIIYVIFCYICKKDEIKLFAITALFVATIMIFSTFIKPPQIVNINTEAMQRLDEIKALLEAGK